MSVYTPQQAGQQFGQQFGQQPYGLQQPGLVQQPWTLQGPVQPFGQLGAAPQLPALVTELSLRCGATAVAALVEQLRMDPSIVMGIQAQGQIPPHAWNTVLTECARRIAPVMHTALAQVTQAHGGQYGQPSYGPSLFGQPSYAQFGQPHFGQMSPIGM